jgi:hypothetical protein
MLAPHAGLKGSQRGWMSAAPAPRSGAGYRQCSASLENPHRGSGEAARTDALRSCCVSHLSDMRLDARVRMLAPVARPVHVDPPPSFRDPRPERIVGEQSLDCGPEVGQVGEAEGNLLPAPRSVPGCALALRCWIPPVKAPGQDLHLRSQRPCPTHLPRRCATPLRSRPGNLNLSTPRPGGNQHAM